MHKKHRCLQRIVFTSQYSKITNILWFNIYNNAVYVSFVFNLPSGYHHGRMQCNLCISGWKKVTPLKIYYLLKIKKNFLSYVHPFTYNAVTLFLSPWEIPVDINNTHICTNRLTARETLLINEKYILRFFSRNCW